MPRTFKDKKLINKLRKFRNEYVATEETGRICGYLGCDGKVLHTEGQYFWSDLCEKCGWGSGGSK